MGREGHRGVDMTSGTEHLSVSSRADGHKRRPRERGFDGWRRRVAGC